MVERYPNPRRPRPFRALALLPLVAACAAPVDPSVTVRHLRSTETAGNGARWHLFLFDPREERSLDERLSLARAQVAREGDCAWVEVPRSAIVEQTEAQGAAYAETLLAAPLRCEV